MTYKSGTPKIQKSTSPNRLKIRALTAGIVMGLSAAFCGQAFAAEVFLDRPIRAGDLTVYQSAYNENQYYYLVDKPVLATNDRGTPKFSFMQYVRGQNEEQITGGGLVHAVVKLQVTDEQIRDALQELRQKRGGSASLEGPVPFRSGSVSLISSTVNEAGDSEDHIVGLGAAPTLENQEIAVAVSIPKAGAEILYASMQTPAPDFTISFNMTIDGYNSPIQAKIEAEWAKVYEHKDIQAAVFTPLLAAELGLTFEKLEKTQAIKIDSLAPDADMQAATDMAYKLILKEAFDPIPGMSPKDALPTVGAGKSDSLLDRAEKMIGSARKEAKEKRLQCEADNRANKSQPGGAAPAAKAPKPVADAPQQVAAVPQPADAAPQPANAAPQPAKAARVEADPDKDYNIQIGDKLYTYGNSDVDPDDKMTLVYEESDDTDLPPGGVLVNKDNDSEHSDYVNRVLNPKKKFTEEEEKQKAYKIAKAQAEVDGGTLSNPPPAAVAETKVAEVEQKDCDAINMPVMAKAVSYKLKKIRHEGKFEMELTKSTAASFPMRFDLNLSGINRCRQCITQVNVDSPLNEPKDIQVSLGGEVGIEAFDSYLNGAEVMIRKTHQDGFVTNESAVFTRATFSESGNLIPIRYLWHNDNDRAEWPLYEFKVIWNLFGGMKEETEWLVSDTDQLVVTPPIKALLVDIDIPPSIAEQNGILAVTLDTDSLLGHRNSTTLNVFREQLSKQHTVLVPRDEPAYQYSMSWQTDTGDLEFGPVDTSSQVILVRPR